jgi:hypothetical protein
MENTVLSCRVLLCYPATSCSTVPREHSSYCCVRWNVYTEPFPSNGYTRHNTYETQVTCTISLRNVSFTRLYLSLSHTPIHTRALSLSLSLPLPVSTQQVANKSNRMFKSNIMTCFQSFHNNLFSCAPIVACGYILTWLSINSLKNGLKMKVKFMLGRTVNRPVLVSSTHLGPKSSFLLLSESCMLVDVGRPLWREDRAVI